jgi:hypothetical protein
MTIQEIINRTLSRYGYRLEDEMPMEEPMEEPAGETQASKTLEDGTEVFSDGDFAAGANVYIVTDEGEQIPLPTGEYTCTDGTMLTVEDGVVTGEPEAAEAPAEEEPMAEEAMSAHLSEMQASYESRISAQKNKIAALQRRIDTLEAEAAPRVSRQSLSAKPARVPEQMSTVYSIFETYN